MFVFLPQDRSNFVCTKCKQVSILEEKVQGLEKQVSTLRCIRENEDFLDRCQDMFLRAQHSEESEQAVQWGQKDGEENWQHVTSRKRKRSIHVPAMQIQDRSNFVCTKCKQVSILEEKVQGLEKQVSTLRCIRENEDFLDRCQDMFLRAQHSEESEQAVQWGQKDGEENWQHVTSRKRKRSIHVPAMQIQESQTLQDIVEQPADTSAISILKNHYPKITVTLKKMFPASGEKKSPDLKDGKMQLIPRDQEGMSGSPVKTIRSELRKSKERTEMSQSSAITLKKIFPASGERKSPDLKDGKMQLIPRDQEGMSGSPVKTIGSELRKSKERTEMSQSSAITLKKIFPASGERKIPDWKMEELSKRGKTLKADISPSQVKRRSLFHLKLKGVQSQRQDPLSWLAKQIEVVSISLTSRDDQIVLTMGRNQKALVSMELATRNDPKQLEICLVEKMPGPMSILRGNSWNEKLGQLEALEKKMEAQFNLLNEKLGSVQKHLEVQLQNPLLVLEAQIIQLRNQLSSIDEKVSQEGEKKLKTIECMRFANRDELKVQEWRYLPEKKEISHLEKKLEQLMNTERKMEEQFRVEMKTRLRETKMLLHEKLGSAQTHLEAQQQNPLLGLEIQIKQLTNRLSSIDQKVSQEIEKKLQTIHSMQFTNRDEMKQWKFLLEKKLSSSQPTLEISHLEKKLEQIEKSEKKMGEQLKAEIKNSLGATEMLLDEKLGSVQTQLEAWLQNPLSDLETQIKQLTNQLSATDQKVSQEIENKLQTLHRMLFASTDELKQWKDLLEKKLSMSQPTVEIGHSEEKLEQLEKSEKKMGEQLKAEIKNSLGATEILLEKKMGEQLKAEIKNSLGATEMLLDEKLRSVQTQLEARLQSPLSGLETQIKQLTNQLSATDQKVSQEIENKLQTLHSMLFASTDELKQWKDLLEKKLSMSQPTVEIGHLEEKLEQLEKSEKKMGEQLKAEIKNSLGATEILLEKKMGEQLKAEIKNSLGATEMLLDEKLRSVQTQLEARLQSPLSGLETQIKQLTNQLSATDQKVSQEIENKLQTLHSMLFASTDELKQWKDLLEKKLSMSQPTVEIGHLEEKLEQLEKSEKKMGEQLKAEIKNSLGATEILLEKKMGEQLKAEIKNSLGATEMLLDEKLRSVQTQLEARLQSPLSGLETQIKQLTNQLSATDQKVSQEIENKLQTLHSMLFASTDELKQWKDLLEKKLSMSQPTVEIGHLEEKLEQLEKSEKKMGEQLKAEIKNSLGATEMLLDEKLRSVQTQLETRLQNPLSGLETQIKQLTNQLSATDQKVSQEIENKLQTLHSMLFASTDELKQWKDLLEKKLSMSQPTVEIGHLEEKLEQLEKSEKKMGEQLKAEIKNSLGATEMLLDEKLRSVQTQLETRLQNPLSGLETQIKQLTNQLSATDQKVSQEIENKLQTLHSMLFASTDELKQWKDLLEKKLSMSQPTVEIGHLEEKLEQLEKSEKKMGEQLKAEIKNSLGATEMLLDEKLRSVQTQLETRLQNPLSGLETQIKQLTNQLSATDQKVSQEIENKLQTLHSMLFASTDELKQWKDLLEKKLSMSQPTVEIGHLEEKLEQLEKSEKKMGEQLKAEIKNSLGATEMLLDEKLRSVQTQLETRLQNPLSGLETQIKQLTNQLSATDQKVSQEIENKLQTLHSMLFASTDELKQWKDLLEKKLSMSQPTVEIGHLEEKLEQLEKSDTEKHFESELKKLRTEIDWRRARNNAGDIILDAGTAHPNLSISGDKKNLKHEAQPQKVHQKPERFDSTVCVLGSEGFSSGKQYWEVDVGSSTDWDLGVARKSIKRKGKLSLSPKEGFWALGVSGKDCWAKTDPWTRVLVQKKVKKIGVYLNYQDGQVTFFNVTDMSVLFTFNDCSFSGAVYPFFKNSHKETIMRICSIKED
ncbi:coiled-coil domain-containing protein 18-like [Chrysemys picta bellii]|uniref:coiled-coil domain-containing protein 18-like n=1 Tax=Chrysemys picta bellii TaxID=8478 RepID=UPI0032B19797